MWEKLAGTFIVKVVRPNLCLIIKTLNDCWAVLVCCTKLEIASLLGHWTQNRTSHSIAALQVPISFSIGLEGIHYLILGGDFCAFSGAIKHRMPKCRHFDDLLRFELLSKLVESYSLPMFFTPYTNGRLLPNKTCKTSSMHV